MDKCPKLRLLSYIVNVYVVFNLPEDLYHFTFLPAINKEKSEKTLEI